MITGKPAADRDSNRRQSSTRTLLGMSSRALLLSLATAAALAVSSVALAGGGLSGKYVTTVKSPAELKGRWAITFAKGGTYTVALNGKTLARGSTSRPRTQSRSLASRAAPARERGGTRGRSRGRH